jgi:Fe2+ or Zn2+ uptake regulation protein
VAELGQPGGSCSPTTVRKTLNEFVEWDLLQTIDVGGGLVFYDTVTAPHAHIYNVDTGARRRSHLSP